MNVSQWRRISWSACVALAVWGCASQPQGQEVVRRLEPADFAAEDVTQKDRASGRASESKAKQAPREDDQQSNDVDAVVPSDAAAAGVVEKVTEESGGVSVTAGTSTPRGIGRSYTVDAMVGQVNGKPIYAAEVLEPIEEQLSVLGKSLPRKEFVGRARQLIEGRLGQIVTDALILGEAERDLTVQEHAGLLQFLKLQREELIRFWGIGSVAVAQENLVRQTSRTLDQTLNETRERMLVQRYLRERLWSKISVSRKDVERYYQEHFSDFNPPANRGLRLIYVETKESADTVGRMLDEGVAFEEVAKQDLNQYRHEEGGLMAEKAVGDEVFGHAVLNEAMLTLRAGEFSGRVQAGGRYWWVRVESIDQPKGRSLSEVQLEVESLLQRQRFQQLTQQYRRELFETGSYNSIDQMGEALLAIAVNRFAGLE